MVELSDIRAARERIREHIVLSPCTPSDGFGEMFGGRAWFKFENLQRTGSFKERGALNRILALSDEERASGVIAASAGNHAQGVAFHAQRLGLRATIVMPERTPLIKVSNTERYGARVVLHGASYDDAMEEAQRIRAVEGSSLVHPFDQDEVIAGQGTIGLEILEQVEAPDVVVVPVGGGGLISGIAVALKALRPATRVIGVEASTVPAAMRARAAGQVVTIPPGDTIADGISVRRIGENTFAHMSAWVDDIVSVDEEEIANAVLLLLEREKTVAEGAAATALAAVVNRRIPDLTGRNVVMLLSGGNIDVNLLARIIERGLMKDGRMARIRVRVPDRPGALAAITGMLARDGANILSLEHRRGIDGLWLTEAEVVLTLELRGNRHLEQLVEALGKEGYEVGGVRRGSPVQPSGGSVETP
jgi:threonine dehydratase